MAYPKWKYHRSNPPQIVDSPEEENALGEGWEETPAAFEGEAEAKPEAKRRGKAKEKEAEE